MSESERRTNCGPFLHICLAVLLKMHSVFCSPEPKKNLLSRILLLDKPSLPECLFRCRTLTRSCTRSCLPVYLFAFFFFFFFPTQLCLYCSVNLLYQSAHFLFLSDFRTFQMADFLAYVSSFPWKLRVLRYILILLMCGLCSNKYYDPVDLNLEHAI